MISDENKRDNVDIPLAGEPESPRRKRKRAGTAARRYPSIRRGVRPAVLIGCAVALAVVIGGAWWVLRTPGEAQSDAELDIVASPSGVNLPFRDGFLSVTSTGYTIYDGDGVSAGFRAASLPNPAALCTAKRFFAYSRGGTAILCADALHEIYSVTAPGSILSASVNDRQELAVVTDAEYHKGEITVYGSDGGVRFSYKAADAYPYLCALSPEGEFLCAALLTCTEEGDPATAVYGFSLSQGKITGSAVLPGETVCSIICNGAENITVITEKGVRLVDRTGEVTASFLPEQAEVCRFAAGGETVYLFCERKEPGAHYELFSVGTDCNVLGRRESETDCLFLCAGERNVAFYDGSRLTVLEGDLSTYALFPADSACRDVMFGTDGRLCAILASKVVFYVIE